MKIADQITAAEIDYWTEIEQERAKEILPKLVYKLVCASCERIKNIHFPAGKSIQFCGVDGYLDVEDGNQFVPSGISAWEFSTSKNIKQKFNSDYEKRSTDSRGISLKDTTFCFVTTRIWNKYPGIGEFENARKHERKWKNVLIIDANVLENWLEHCPEVSTWFAEIMGKPVEYTSRRHDNGALLQQNICEKKRVASIWKLIAIDIIMLLISCILMASLLAVTKKLGFAVVTEWQSTGAMLFWTMTFIMCWLTVLLVIGKRPCGLYRQGTIIYTFRAKKCPYCGSQMKFYFDDKGAAVCKCRNNERDHYFAIDHTQL